MQKETQQRDRKLMLKKWKLRKN